MYDLGYSVEPVIYGQHDGKVKVHDETLQQTIIAAMLYDLPLPEYDNHSGCIRQMLGDVIVCAQHKGNQPKIWMGVY